MTSKPPAAKSREGDFFFHETAIIDPGSEIGEGTKVWHFSHILPNCKIGGGCTIGQNVMIGPNVTIGTGCKIQNNVSVYTGVTLEDDVFCGPGAVFTNVVNPRAAIERKHEFKDTRVKTGATIGANATIVCGHTIGRYAFVGAGSVVTSDVPDYTLVTGNPARPAGFMCACGEQLADGDWAETHCAVCSLGYRRDQSGINAISENYL